MFRRYGFLFVAIGVMCLATLGCTTAGSGGGGGGGDDEGEETATPDAVAGQTTYGASCMACHGEPGAGDGAAPDLAGIGATALETGATAETHAEVGDVSEDDYANLAAYLATAGGGEDDGEDEGDGV